MTSAPTVGRCLRDGEARLRGAGIPDARAEAEFLLGAILRSGRAALRLEGGRALEAGQARRWRTLLARRLRREPLAYVLGRQPFHDIELAVRPGVFIPRPETEELVEAAAAMLLGMSTPPRILDLCTGSGAIALALAKRFPAARVVAVEKNASALAAARANGRRLALAVRWLAGDLYAPLSRGERFDLIVSNPPYVRSAALRRLSPEVRREPAAALDGGVRGLDILERIVAGAAGRLAAGGVLALEMDPPQTRTVAVWLRQAGFPHVAVKKDMQGRGRIVLGRHG